MSGTIITPNPTPNGIDAAEVHAKPKDHTAYGKFLTFLQESDGMFSWGRVSGSATVAAAIFSLIYVVLKTHAIPDAITLSGLCAFGGFPFALSKGIAAMAKPTAGQ